MAVSNRGQDSRDRRLLKATPTAISGGQLSLHQAHIQHRVVWFLVNSVSEAGFFSAFRYTEKPAKIRHSRMSDRSCWGLHFITGVITFISTKP